MAVIKFHFFVLTAIIYTAALAPGTNAKKPNKIVGGTRANITQFRCMVALENGWTHQTCGGTLISPRHVMSAAHCAVIGRENRDPHMYPKRYLNVKSGSSNRRDVDKVLVSSVCNVNVHKDFLEYPPSPTGDIMILTLCEDIPFGPTRMAATLPTRQYREGEKGMIVGWGWTQPEDSISVDDLRKAPMTITSVNDDHFLAKAESGIAFCNGDSGSPMIINNTVVGVISNSPDCSGDYAGSYTNVFRYTTWIDDVMVWGGQSVFSGYVREMKVISNYR